MVVDNRATARSAARWPSAATRSLGVDFDSPDFAALGRALGCHGVFADSRAALDDALRSAFAADRPTVIHVPE